MVRVRSAVLAVAILTLLIFAACGGGGRSALQPSVAPAQPAEDTQQAVPPGSGAEGSHEEQNLNLPPIPPPWEQDIPPGYPTWTDPETGETHVLNYLYFGESLIRWTQTFFKPDEWWIEEDYPIDESTPPWKLHEDAAVEELRSRGYTIWQTGYVGGVVPHWYDAFLPKGKTFFDIEHAWPAELPCIDRVTPLVCGSPCG